jgi:hypothetical protein
MTGLLAGEQDPIPVEILDWVARVFRACNRRITKKIDMSPNAPEPSLDQTWIEHLSHYSSPVAFENGWHVKIETHYLGGMRHWLRWEIADIGIIVRYKIPEGVLRRKIGLLQSKRLLPSNTRVREEIRVDYEIGFGRLDDREDDRVSLSLARQFSFDLDSKYGEIEYGSEQLEAIEEFQSAHGLHVWYQLYNPWRIPWTGRIPLVAHKPPQGNPSLGVRLSAARASRKPADREPVSSGSARSASARKCSAGRRSPDSS